MNSFAKKLTAEFNVNPPASIEAIRQFEYESGVSLSEDYTAFLMYSNGGEGFIGKRYASLWRLEDLAEKNRSYRVADCAPGLYLFGSDGGGEAFAFDLRSNEQPIVCVPFVPLDLREAQIVASTFEGFFAVLSDS